MMNVATQIKTYLESLPQGKKEELETLHEFTAQLIPNGPLWFLDGRDEQGKVVANPNIGYGNYTMQYANGKTKDFYRVGLSANTSGISVYIMGLKDKNYLKDTYSNTLGKATITGYRLKFKTLKDIQWDVLQAAIKDGLEQEQ